MAAQRVTEKKKPDAAKNIRAVKAMVRQVEWLAWSVVWEENKFIYKNGKEKITPEGLVLSNTQRQIYKVNRYPVAAAVVLGNVAAWKEKMESLLDRAKYFASLGSPDFDQLKKVARSGNAKLQKQHVADLLNLLEVEATCSNTLPVSPCLLLIEINRSAALTIDSSEFGGLLRSANVSPPAKALAALVMGTADGGALPDMQKDESGETKAWLTRCFQLGKTRCASIDLDPLLLVNLLASQNGSAIAREFIRLNRELVYFHLPLKEFRGLLCNGTKGDTILSLAKQFAIFEEIAETLLAYRSLIPHDLQRRDKKKASQKLEGERVSAVKNIRLQLVELACDSPSSVLLRRILDLINDFLTRYRVSSCLLDEILELCALTVSLKPELRDDFLEILNSNHELIWKGKSVGKAAAPEKGVTGADENDDSTESTAIATSDASEIYDSASFDITCISSKFPGNKIIPDIFQSLKTTGNASLVRSALLSHNIHNLRLSGLTKPAMCEKFLGWCQRVKFREGAYEAKQLARLMNATTNFSEIESHIEKFFKSLEHAEESQRNHYFQVVSDFDYSKRAIKTDLHTASEFLPRLIDVTIDDESCNCPCFSLMRVALQIGRKVPDLSADLIAGMADFYSRHPPMEHKDLENFERGCRFALSVIPALREGPQWHAVKGGQANKINYSAIMEESASSFILHKPDSYSQVIDGGFEILKENALLARLLSDKFKSQPHRCIRFLGNLGVTKKLGGKTKQPFLAIQGYSQKERALAAIARHQSAGNDDGANLSELRASGAIRLEIFDQHSIKRLSTKGWSKVAALAPELVPYILSYICSRSIMKQSQEPPAAVLKVLSMKVGLIKQKEHLESKLARIKCGEESSRDEKNLRTRLKNIDQRLKNESGIVAQIRKLLNKHVRHLSSDAEMCALERLVLEVLRNHFRTIIGAQAKEIVVDSFLLNALLMTQDVSSNKRLLRKLIKAYVDGDREWRHRIPANGNFLADLKAADTEPDIWLGSHLRTFKFDGVKGNLVTIHLETEPLKILEMGNYFDTCLSFGGENSFATVTNAVDLNKRVVYVFDKQGNAVGRKLIGINADGHLIGFRTYTSIEDDAQDEALKKIITNYVRAFAQMCNLKLSSVGTVQPLATKLWYDDGVECWEEPEVDSGSTDKTPDGNGGSAERSGKNVECRKEGERRERKEEATISQP